jgi:ion channel-forming bestrophin family protein
MTPPSRTEKLRNKARFKKNTSLRSWKRKFHEYTGEKLTFFQVIFRLQGSVIKSIIPWLLFFSGYSFFIALLEYHDKHIPLPKISSGVPNVVLSLNLILSLLLIFRTNTAHERFWEGRKLWGSLVNTVRNLARGICVVVEERGMSDRVEKEAALRLAIAFAVAMKLHLRHNSVNKELKALMSPSQYLKLKEINHPPLEIALWLGEYLQSRYRYSLLNVYQLTALQKLVDELVDILGGCERIIKTPMPLLYAIFLKQLLILYCLILPVELVENLHWWTIPVMALMSFTLFGIEELGSELENPFGRDPNDLPLDEICRTILRNVEDLMRSTNNETHSNQIPIVLKSR